MKYFNKSLRTLKTLMALLLISFHYDRLFQKHETDYTIDTLLMLLQRNRKLYAAINSLQTIFKLFFKRKQMLADTDSCQVNRDGEAV